jgi:hypothetical protein
VKELVGRFGADEGNRRRSPIGMRAVQHGGGAKEVRHCTRDSRPIAISARRRVASDGTPAIEAPVIRI